MKKTLDIRRKALCYAISHNKPAQTIKIAQAYYNYLSKDSCYIGLIDYRVHALGLARKHNADYQTTIEAAERYCEYLTKGKGTPTRCSPPSSHNTSPK